MKKLVMMAVFVFLVMGVMSGAVYASLSDTDSTTTFEPSFPPGDDTCEPPQGFDYWYCPN